MALPAGFTVNGRAEKAVLRIPAQLQRLMTFLDSTPENDLFTTLEVAERLGISAGGNKWQSSAIADYREKVDGKIFWGSKASIAQLRRKLEESNGEDS